MNVEEMTALKAMFAEHQKSLRREVTRPPIPSRSDWKGWVTMSLGILGVVAAFTMFIFKTNAAADLEHQKIVSTHTYDIGLQKMEQRQLMEKLETLNENQILIGKRVQAKGVK